MNPDKIRNVLNILFMILALRMWRGNFCQADGVFYTVHQQISIRALKHFKSA